MSSVFRKWTSRALAVLPHAYRLRSVAFANLSSSVIVGVTGLRCKLGNSRGGGFSLWVWVNNPPPSLFHVKRLISSRRRSTEMVLDVYTYVVLSVLTWSPRPVVWPSPPSWPSAMATVVPPAVSTTVSSTVPTTPWTLSSDGRTGSGGRRGVNGGKFSFVSAPCVPRDVDVLV